MPKKLTFEVKEKMVELSGTCFWYWNGFYSFLDSCGISKSLRERCPRDAYNKYTLMRALLEHLEETGKTDLINALISGFYRLKGPRDRDQLNEDKAKRLLAEFKELIGNDPIEVELAKQARERARVSHESSIVDRRERDRRMEELNNEFLALTSGTEVTPQQRGFEIEKLFFKLIHLCELEHTPPYRTPGREQIDGHFRYQKFDYLVEAKWTEEPAK